MNQELTLRIILERPPVDVIFGLQKGSGNDYETIQVQRSGDNDLEFEFPITVKLNKEGQPNFLGPFVQGLVSQRFVYIGIGTYAGHKESIWGRRLKVPLTGISLATIREISSDNNKILEARVPGTGKDNGPNCATVKPFTGWHMANGTARQS